jgi:hypothetical protein
MKLGLGLNVRPKRSLLLFSYMNLDRNSCSPWNERYNVTFSYSIQRTHWFSHEHFSFVKNRGTKSLVNDRAARQEGFSIPSPNSNIGLSRFFSGDSIHNSEKANSYFQEARHALYNAITLISWRVTWFSERHFANVFYTQ